MKTSFTILLIAIMTLNVSGQQTIKKTKNIKQISEALSRSIATQTFSDLPYSYDALEPYFDKMTMEIHHSKHHKAYYTNMITAVANNQELGSIKLLDLFNLINS